jgi:uncharacterized protein YbjQ (UPF0145 family)
MLITTQDQLEQYNIKRTLGMVQGSTIRARHIGTDILAGLRNIVGGEVHEYTKNARRIEGTSIRSHENRGR